MNIKNSSALVLALFALVCNLSTTFVANAQESNNQPTQTAKSVVKKAVPVKTATPVKVNKAENRYRATPEFVSVEKAGFTQPKYTGPATLNGLGLKSAEELGVTGKITYNEYEQSARVVVLSPLAMLYYDTASLEPLYLAGCLRDGKPYANRIKLLEPVKAPEPKPVPVATPASTPVVSATPEPKPVPVVKAPHREMAPVAEEMTSHYVVDQYSDNGKINVVSATDLFPTLVVVDVPQPNVRVNGRLVVQGQPLQANQGPPQGPPQKNRQRER